METLMEAAYFGGAGKLKWLHGTKASEAFHRLTGTRPALYNRLKEKAKWCEAKLITRKLKWPETHTSEGADNSRHLI
jgi:hypothetical protein